MKTIIISTIALLFILMGVSDALRDNGSITVSKIIEAFYLGVLFIVPVLITRAKKLPKINLIHYLLCLAILHQSLVNISYGIVRDGISWYYLGSTSYVDMVLNWFINDALKTPQAHFLAWYYLLPSMVALFVLHRNAIKS